MRRDLQQLEAYRVQAPPPMAQSKPGDPFGYFRINKAHGKGLVVILSCDYGWEHASVSAKNRVPTWAEMMRVKELVWEPEEVVMQLAPKESEYINFCRYALHWWRPKHVEVPRPPRWMVGPYPNWEGDMARDVIAYEKLYGAPA